MHRSLRLDTPSLFILLLIGTLFGLGCQGEQTSPAEGPAADSGAASTEQPAFTGSFDAFEDGDQQSDLGAAWEVIAEGAGTVANASLETGGFGAASSHHLGLQGTRPAEATGSQVVGLRVAITEKTGDQEVGRDATGYTGLAFSLRGTPGTYIVQLGSTQIQDFDFYNAYIESTGTWSEFKIPFSQFGQEGFGQTQPWTGQDLSHIAFYANLTGDFDFGIDDVRFYRE